MRAPGIGRAFISAVAACGLAACVGLAPGQLSSMSAVDLCEYLDVQGPNLTDDARRAVLNELDRRKDNCRNHAAEVAQRRELALHEWVYGSPDDP